jgi:DNA-binding NarL/FixJ family response regulator
MHLVGTVDRADDVILLKVLVVDDRSMIAYDPESLVAQVQASQPHVLLMDYVTLTQRNGALVLADVRTACPDVKLMILTQSDDEATLSTCLQAGAAASINKHCSPEELVRSVKRVHAGEVLFASEQLFKLLTRPPLARPDTSGAGLKHRITPRELEVLCAFATGASTSEVADQLGISVHTVRTHLKNAISNLGARSKFQAILFALKEGPFKPSS